MSKEAHIAELLKQKEDQKRAVQLRDLSIKMAENKHFKELILDEFCVKEAARYVQNSANPALSADQRADCLGIAQSSGHLRRWLSVLVQMGNQAASQIAQIDEQIDELRQMSDEDYTALAGDATPEEDEDD